MKAPARPLTRQTRFLAGASLVLLLLCLTIGLTGCGPSDEERIAQALTNEFELVKQHDDAYIADVMSQDTASSLQQTGIDAQSYISSFLDGFDYRIDAIEIDKDHAIANVAITCKSLSDITQALQNDLQNAESSGAGVNMTEDQITETVAENALGYIQNAQAKEHEPFTISLTLQNKEWVVDPQVRSAIENVMMQ